MNYDESTKAVLTPPVSLDVNCILVYEGIISSAPNSPDTDDTRQIATGVQKLCGSCCLPCVIPCAGSCSYVDATEGIPDYDQQLANVPEKYVMYVDYISPITGLIFKGYLCVDYYGIDYPYAWWIQQEMTEYPETTLFSTCPEGRSGSIFGLCLYLYPDPHPPDASVRMYIIGDNECCLLGGDSGQLSNNYTMSFQLTEYGQNAGYVSIVDSCLICDDATNWIYPRNYAKNDKVKIDSSGHCYICYQNHTSSINTRPETGLNWQNYWVKF
jgi:hypothetical protein